MVLALVRSVGLALLIYGVLMFALQRRLAFPGASRESLRATATEPPGVTQAWLDASFGSAEAWFFGAPARATAPTIVFAHGNGELIEDWESAMERVARSGVVRVSFSGPSSGIFEGKGVADFAAISASEMPRAGPRGTPEYCSSDLS
ncbi:MAG: hypothetical protein EXR91_02830 [Gemmatimonadetes bacterium]|nr:hypothetical protein [Gemmatimonadota bacterium]